MSNVITMGMFWHLVDATSAACFYVPFKKVKKWSWKTVWSADGIVSWITLPRVVSALLLPNFWAYYNSFSLSARLPILLFGAMQGIGNINHDLTMRYLGMSMGIGIAISIMLIVDTLMTPIIDGNFDVLISTEDRRVTLLGVLVTLIGVETVARAEQLKERRMGTKAEELSLKKRPVLAVMCGIPFAGMFSVMNVAKPIYEAAAALGVDPPYVALPSYVVITSGDAITNLGSCFICLAKVKDLSLKVDFSLVRSLIIHNVLPSALGGLIWHLRFFFYAWGHAHIPAQYDYIGWMLHTSFYVLCGGIVGLVLREWNNAGHHLVTVLSLGYMVTIVVTNIVDTGMAN